MCDSLPDVLSAADLPVVIQHCLAIARDSTLSPQRRIGAIGALAAATDRLFVCGRLDVPSASPSSLQKRNADPGNLLSPSPSTPSPRADAPADIVRPVSTALDEAARLLQRDLLPALADEGYEIVHEEQLTDDEIGALEHAFRRTIFPLLMPLAVDPGRPFPKLASGQLNLLIRLRPLGDGSDMDARWFAVVRLPTSLPRLVPVPPAARSGARRYLWLEDLVAHRQRDLFPGLQVVDARLFRVLRRARPVAAGQPADHITGPIVRLDIETGLTWDERHWLMAQLQLSASAIVRSASPLALADLAQAESLFPPHKHLLRQLAERLWRVFFGHIRTVDM